jgi:hypothetical protein
VANGDRGDRGLDEADNGGDVKVPRSKLAVDAAAAVDVVAAVADDDTPRRNVEGTLPPPSSGEPPPDADDVPVADAIELPPDAVAIAFPAACVALASSGGLE